MTTIGPEWQLFAGVAAAWFDAPSLSAAAALTTSLAELPGAIAIDLRSTGVRVCLDSVEHGHAVSAAAEALGLTADPAGLQQLGVVIESANPAEVGPFWQRVLGYAPGQEGDLADPLRRDPTISVRPSAQLGTLRNRVHLDVVRPAEAVAQLALGDGSGPYGVCHADADGNEVDLVPGDGLDGGDATADWQAVFSAMACYRVSSAAQQSQLAIRPRPSRTTRAFRC